MKTLLAAHTPADHSYPPFINISLNGDFVEVTVRSAINPDGGCGDIAMIALPIHDFENIMENATSQLFLETNSGALQALRKAS